MDEYLPGEEEHQKWGRLELMRTASESDMSGEVSLTVELRDGDQVHELKGSGNGPISAFIEILNEKGMQIDLLDYVEHTLSASGDAQAAAYIELKVDDGDPLWGVGIDGDIATASLKALISGVNRAVRG
jgi:2-isopropylmalate synthase